MLKWKLLGNMSSCWNNVSGGVYLIVHKSKFNRVVYVGTTNCFGRRVRQHFYGFLKGNRTIWKVNESEDLYELMTSMLIRNYIKYFKQLAADKKVWASTTIEKNHPENLLLLPQVFDEEWQNYLKRHYLPNLEIWGLEINPYDARRAVLIESAIQQRLVKVFSLGRFFNHRDLSILGKIEFNNSRVIVSDKIINTPELDDVGKIILSSLNQGEIPEAALLLVEKQFADLIKERSLIKEIRRKQKDKMILKYPKYGTIWDVADMEKLRVMLVDFKMEPAEMTGYLERSEKSIISQIDKNDRLTSGSWRKFIGDLF